MERPNGQVGCGWGVCVRAVKTPLLVLTCLAMTGILIESYFINRFYYFKMAGGPERVQPCTPFAYLSDVEAGYGHLLQWRNDPHSDGCDLIYKNGSLEVRKDGYYFLFSTVAFVSEGLFKHSVNMFEPAYPISIRLMHNIFWKDGGATGTPSYSYLSGIFFLNREVTFFVEVSNYSQIVVNYHNSFGAFMLW